MNDSAEAGSPAERDDGIPWIVASALGLFIGWVFAIGAMANSTLGVSSDRISNGEVLAFFVAATSLALGPPTVGCVVLSRRRRRSGGVSWVGFAGCVIFFVFGSLTLLLPTIDQAVSAITIAVQRAQPPTPLEQRRTIAEARAEVTQTGERTVASMGKTASAESAEVRNEECTLSNFGTGMRAVYRSASPPRSDASRELSDQEGEQITKPAVALWERRGLVVDSDFGQGGVSMVGTGTISTVIIGRAGAVVTIESACFTNREETHD